MNKLIPFLNAGIQGADKFLRSFKDHPVGTSFKTLAYVTFPSFLITAYALLTLDENRKQEYLEFPKWIRDTNWLIKVGENWYRIPKPFIHGLIFGSFPERGLDQLYKKSNNMQTKEDWELFKGAVFDILNSLSPVQDVTSLISPLAKTIYEGANNKDLYTGGTLYPQHLEKRLRSERYGRNTTELSKSIGKVLNWSPAVIDN